MQYEIEIKLKYEEEDKDEIIAKLNEMGANSEESYELHDTYFSLKHKDMSNAHDLIRIRNKNGKAELTFKGKCETEGHIWKRMELSSGITEPEKMIQILKYLEFNIISENKSQRELWRLNDIEILFIDFTSPSQLKFLEIEASSEEKIQSILQCLGDLVTKVGEENFQKFDEAREKTNKG